jgi:hypothetical protein
MTTAHIPAHPSPLLAAALAAVERGWPVFPLAPGSKRPAVPDWETAASLDPDVLARWWYRHGYNIGLACGPADLLVVDLDRGHGAPPAHLAAAGVTHGRDMLALLARQAGVADPVDTYTVTTPHGQHRYFTAPGRQLRSSVERLGWAIDTRGSGGYVVAAGSLHRHAGRTRRYTVAVPGPAAPLPGWLAAALTPTHDPAAAAARAPVPTMVGGRRVAAYTDAAVAGEVRNVKTAKPGTRNHTLFVAAARLGGLVAAGVLDQTRARTVLVAAAGSHVGVEEFTAAEARRTIDNGLRRGLQEPRRLD